MKKYAFLAALCISTGLFAKQVKFSVNMSLQVVNVNGVHITGDFQDEAGYPADWDPGTTAMMQEPADTNIYSVVLDLPAFAKYEFKFVNGIFGYEQEFVPVPSRVNFNFIDSRWIYVDSLSNDTQLVAPIRFGENAPAGKFLVRFYVDMQNETSVNGAGVHVAGAFQDWDPATTRLYSLDGNVYEYITYVDTGMTSFAHVYKFANGNTAGDYETVPSPCADGSGNRSVMVASDTMLQTICYAACVSCASVGINESVSGETIDIYPNPAGETFTIAFNDNVAQHHVTISDAMGRLVLAENGYAGNTFSAATGALAPGIYTVRVENAEKGSVIVQKLVIR